MRDEYPQFAASVPCYHLEGPYLSAGGAHGAHDPALMRIPNWLEFERLQAAARGRIGIVTIAPELAGARNYPPCSRCRCAGGDRSYGWRTRGYSSRGGRRRTAEHSLGNGCAALIPRHKTPIGSTGRGRTIRQHHLRWIPPSHGRGANHQPHQSSRPAGTDYGCHARDRSGAGRLPPGTHTIRLLPSGQIVTLTSPSSLGGSTLTMDRAIQGFQALARVPIETACRRQC